MSRDRFDHEKLEVYQRSLEFIVWVTPFLAGIAESAGSTSEIRNQLDRASLSILLNTAEGNGKRKPGLRARFFDDARGSATECGACLDACVAKGLAAASGISAGKSLLIRIVSMLTKLIERNDNESRACDDETHYDTTPPPS